VAALAREALTVPETLGADDLLVEMRRRGVREALVIDEYGGTAGLITFESLMARIVGDLGMRGAGRARIELLPDGSANIDGLTLVTDVNERFGLHIDATTYTTVGGFVLGRLGRRPRVGDAIDVNGRRVRVEAIDGIRVAKLWLSKPRKRSAAPDAGNATDHHKGQKG
jgi:putative hemolysin